MLCLEPRQPFVAWYNDQKEAEATKTTETDGADSAEVSSQGLPGLDHLTLPLKALLAPAALL